MHEYKAHLKQHFDAIHDCRGIAIIEAFGAIAALEEEFPSRCNVGEIRF
jgi:hypothetical protein